MPLSRTSSEPTKEVLRTRFRGYRHSLSDEHYERASLRIVERAVQLKELRSASTVHVYWPMIEQHEIDTRVLISRLEDMDVEIVLPVVVTFEPGLHPVMNHVRHPGMEQLRKNRWGITEPAHGERVDVATIDAVIVPALGAGRNLHRIGQGRGYYDAFLAEVEAPKVCLVYHDCLIDRIPFDAHDVPMNMVVTEHEVVSKGGL